MITIDFSGQNAVVTGGARGIGKAIAMMLARGGANVWIGDIISEAADTAKEIADTYGVRTGCTKTDVGNLDQVKKLFTDAAQLGKLDILVHGAGIILTGPSLNASEEEIRKITEINLIGSFFVLSEGGKIMKANESGKIVSISSIAGRVGIGVQGHYSATKAAMLNYAQALAVELAPYNIRVNTICPGIIRTQMWDRILQEAEERGGITQQEEWDSYMIQIPQGRPQSPEEIASAAIFFCSDLASAITGQALNVDGGMRRF